MTKLLYHLRFLLILFILIQIWPLWIILSLLIKLLNENHYNLNLIELENVICVPFEKERKGF